MNRRVLVTALAVAAAVGAAAVWQLQRHAPPPAARTATLVPADPHPFDWLARGTPFAGDGRVGAIDGPGAQARFADPYGLAADERGTLFVADGGTGNRIRIVQADGRVSTLAGGIQGFADGTGAAARFDTPSGIAVDRAGNLYVADTANHAIRKVTPAGAVTTLAGDGTPGDRDGPGAQARFNGPLGVAVDAAGRVLVADTYNDRIRAIAPDGMVSTLAGGPAPGDADGPGALARFDTPCGIAVDATGRIWVADTRNDALRTIAADGRVTTLLRGDPADRRGMLHHPLSIAVTREGALLVGTARGNVLQRSPQGELTVMLSPGLQGYGPATGIAAGSGKRVFLADAAAARLHLLVPRTEDEPAYDGPVGPAPDRPLPATAGRWPLRPQLAWHEVVGTIGEVRGDGQGELRDHFHDGLDVRGDVGQEVVAIADGTVLDPLPAFGFGKLGEGLAVDALTYVHMRVGRDAKGAIVDPARFLAVLDDAGKLARIRVRRGTRFAAGDVLGTINPMAHVHLALGAGYPLNPLALGFKGFRDRVAPVVAAIEIHGTDGKRLLRKAKGRLLVPRGELELVVDAWDHVDDNLPRRRLGLYSLGYQWLQADGTPLPGFEQAREAIRFDTLPLDTSLVQQAYADASGITVQGSAQTHFRYRVSSAERTGPVASGAWSTAALAPGDYTLRIFARDFSGNEATRGRDLAVRVE